MSGFRQASSERGRADMKVYAPDYYGSFECIKDKCLHNCCIGWEIDIDEETNDYYSSVGGEFGQRLAKSIANEPDGAHFVLGEGERCPFLNEQNLCDIITNLGEDALCQICADHPRFRNFFDSRTEIGLGLCCEAAARLILTNGKKLTLIKITDDDSDEMMTDEETEFFALRDEVFEILGDRSESVQSRMTRLMTKYGISLDTGVCEWVVFYRSLERLDDAWTDKLDELAKMHDFALLPDADMWEGAFEALAVYFVYRHLAQGMYDGRIRERIAFACISVYIIRALCLVHSKKYGSVMIDDIAELARMYSSEIEYSEDNLEALLGKLGE